MESFVFRPFVLGKEAPVPTEEDAVWAPVPVWTSQRRENLSSMPGTKLRFLGRPAHYIEW